MNDLLSLKRISSFVPVLQAYKQANIDLFNFIDGGAGFGGTAKEMLPYLPQDGKCFAFEPFPGNLRFFEGMDPRVQLIPKALTSKKKISTFQVSSVVTQGSDWGKRGMEGYSSVGRLSDQSKTSGLHDIEVECVRADEVIDPSSRVGFVKLDLQGGEMEALRGMSSFLQNVQLLWVEYSGQPELYEFLSDSGFITFDTEYFFLGEPQTEALNFFNISKRDISLSIGMKAWFGFRNRAWNNYKTDFEKHKKSLKMIQTDLLCVNKKYIDNFINASQFF